MRILVTGANGFLGKSLISQLKDSEIIINALDLKFDQKHEKVNYFEGSILDENLVLCASSECDYIIHYAAIADIGYSMKNPINTLNVNIIGTSILLEAAKTNKIKHIFFSSTLYVSGIKGSFYRISKQTCEELFEYYATNYGITSTLMRLGSLYGPNSNDFNFINQSIMSAIKNGVIYRYGDGEELREYIHVDDINKFVIKLMYNDSQKFQRLVISGNEKLKVSEILKMIKELFNENIEIKYLNDKEYSGHYKFTPYSFKPDLIEKAQLESNVDLASGILSCIYDVYNKILNDNTI
jgi:UDP-glucose 4-epimerase